MDKQKMEKAFSLFDNYNSRDIKRFTWDGVEYPQELFLAHQLYAWVNKLAPDPSEALLLASRCQHIGRWEIARSSYPDGKAGYLNWRSNLAKYHASKAGELLLEAGYESEVIEQVQKINLKRDLKTNLDVQTMENALCLVFLEFEYDGFIQKHEDAKVIRILQKTWAKMTEPGRDAALSLSFSLRGTELIKKALS